MAAFLLRTISLTAAATAATAYLLEIFSRSGSVGWFMEVGLEKGLNEGVEV